jgi:hypothetical protein
MTALLDKKIKLFWDFKGPSAYMRAQRYEKHILHYAELEELKFNESDCIQISENHSMVTLIVAEFELALVKDDLNPDRGEYVLD